MRVYMHIWVSVCVIYAPHYRYMDSPYHNSRHAADVTQGMYYLISFGECLCEYEHELKTFLSPECWPWLSLM